MPQRPVEEIAREMAEEIYIIGNRLTSFDTKKEEIATVIAAALAADREQFREQLETQGQEIAMLQARERTMVEEFWDQDSVSCGNCGIQIVARGGSLNGNNGLSKAEGEDLSLCGFCAAVDMCHLERLSKQLTAKRARCEELESALRRLLESSFDNCYGSDRDKRWICHDCEGMAECIEDIKHTPDCVIVQARKAIDADGTPASKAEK